MRPLQLLRSEESFRCLGLDLFRGGSLRIGGAGGGEEIQLAHRFDRAAGGRAGGGSSGTALFQHGDDGVAGAVGGEITREPGVVGLSARFGGAGFPRDGKVGHVERVVSRTGRMGYDGGEGFPESIERPRGEVGNFAAGEGTRVIGGGGRFDGLGKLIDGANEMRSDERTFVGDGGHHPQDLEGSDEEFSLSDGETSEIELPSARKVAARFAGEVDAGRRSEAEAVPPVGEGLATDARGMGEIVDVAGLGHGLGESRGTVTDAVVSEGKAAEFGRSGEITLTVEFGVGIEIGEFEEGDGSQSFEDRAGRNLHAGQAGEEGMARIPGDAIPFFGVVFGHQLEVEVGSGGGGDQFTGADVHDGDAGPARNGVGSGAFVGILRTIFLRRIF